jgi:hypothetical protein
MVKVAGALHKSSEVMKIVNDLMKVGSMQGTMREMARGSGLLQLAAVPQTHLLTTNTARPPRILYSRHSQAYDSQSATLRTADTLAWPWTALRNGVVLVRLLPDLLCHASSSFD